jgi:hypothetical protein
MNLRDILAKLKRGETLTDAEQAFLDSYDPQAILDTAAANARRKAEEKLKLATDATAEANQRAQDAQAALDAKNEEGKPENEKLTAENDRLKAQIVERDTQIVTLSKDKDGLTREAKLDSVLRQAGIVFVEKVDANAMSGLFKTLFGELSLEDLDDEAQVAAIVEKFTAANEAIIADTSGNGSGDEPKDRITFQGSSITNPWSKETFNLTLQGQIQKEDPSLAEKLKKSAVA